MAGLRTIAYNRQPFLGQAPNKLAVILNQPAHHFALNQMPLVANNMATTLAALGADSEGLKLNITRVRRP